jgi:hypothetical protein
MSAAAQGGSSQELPAPPLPCYPILKEPGSPYTSVRTLSFSEDMNPKYRSTMEDASAMLDGFGGDPSTGYFGIYDGHGGRNVAEFLRLHLHVNVENELKLKGDRSVEECLRAAFLYTDIMCHGTGEQASGSTAVVCLVRSDAAKRYVYTANCGDARAVLCHKGAAVRLSKVRGRGGWGGGKGAGRLVQQAAAAAQASYTQSQGSHTRTRTHTPPCTRAAGSQGHGCGREDAH